MVECNVCIELVNQKYLIACKNKECRYECCIKCQQKYLLESTQDPHCMNCKHEISFQDFITLFPKSWRLTKYKEHCKEIIWAKEQANMHISHDYLSRQKLISETQKKIEETEINLRALKGELFALKYNQNHNSTLNDIVQNSYKYKCPSNDCNGSLDSKYCCIVCDIKYCKHCFEILTEDHVCDDEKKESVKQIKKEANPCPTCGEMISKVSGCAQIFCTRCGTAFNWKTGNIETGIIHNPHAAQYYADNPEAREIYAARIRDVDDVDHNNCEVTQFQIDTLFRKNRIKDNKLRDNLISATVGIYNFRNYYHAPAEVDAIDNNDVRIKWLKKEINDKKAKSTLHQRHKSVQRQRMDYDILSMYFNMLNDLLRTVLTYKTWTMVDNIWNAEFFRLRNYANEQLQSIANYFAVKSMMITADFQVKYEKV